MRTLLFLLATVATIAYAEPTKEERELAARYNLPPEVVKLQQDTATNQAPKTINDVVEQMAKECAAGVKASCPQPSDGRSEVLEFIFGKALASAVGVALLAALIELIRRMMKK